jgi:hypothetical protein
MSICAV